MARRVRFRVVRVRPALILGVLLCAVLATVTGGAAARQAMWQVTLRSLEGRTVVIDPGHGGPDPGAVSASGAYEKDVVLQIAFKLRDVFEAAGARVLMTRTTDAELASDEAQIRDKRADLKKRLAIVRSAGPGAVFLCIHANGFPSSYWSGAQVFYYRKAAKDSRLLAEFIQQELRRITRRTEREVNDDIDQFLLRESPIPSVTVEVGFMSNPEEAALLQDPKYQERIAWAIFLGTARFLAKGSRPALPGRSQ